MHSRRAPQRSARFGCPRGFEFLRIQLRCRNGHGARNRSLCPEHLGCQQEHQFKQQRHVPSQRKRIGRFHQCAGEHGNSVDVLGTDFTEARVEVSGSGTTVLAGLRATYNASHNLVADASSSFVMGVNEARTGVQNVGGVQTVPLPFIADQRGGLTVEVVSLQTSSTVLLQDGGMVDAQPVLTPSKEWQTITTEYQVIGGTITHYRLDVYSKSNQATYLFPAEGGGPAGLGDASMVELHPTDAIEITEDGMNVMTNITFRLRPMWDDEMQLTATSRLVLQSGVISIPFSHTWGTFNAQGYENDLALKSVVFSEDGVDMAPTRQYLRGGESMNLSIEVGFEGVSASAGSSTVTQRSRSIETVWPFETPPPSTELTGISLKTSRSPTAT